MLAGFLAGSVRLRQWSLERGVKLTDDLAGLEILDAHLDEWNVDPTHHGRIDLANEVGIQGPTRKADLDFRKRFSPGLLRVEVRGFEPRTPCMPCKCSTS